ncbi:MAG TPA: hypothetical protein DCS42_07025 [Nitrospiraceae bacterium]|jgi:PAS domain S-box-containing protein|nr:hypothetical protein [Nitrospiraceae bacterium]
MVRRRKAPRSSLRRGLSRQKFSGLAARCAAADPASQRPGTDGRTGGQGASALQHLEALVDSLSAGVISLDGSGRIRAFNAAAEGLFSISRAAVLGLTFHEAERIILFEDATLQNLWERLADSVWAAGAALELEYDLPARNGQRRVISYSVYPLGRMTWSLDNGVVVVFDDITRKKEMEDQISEARKRLQAVFDGITDGIQVVDGDFLVRAVNKSMTALLRRRIAVGEHCFSACVFGARICEDCPAAKTFDTGLPASVVKKLQPSLHPAADGGERVVEITTFPLLDRANRVTQVVEYIKDITDRVRMNERLEHSRRLAELGEMAARVAHELRNPLNAIAGAAHYLAAEHAESETVRKFTDLIKRQSLRMDKVAADLLSVSKPMRIQLRPVNINAVIEQALDPLCEHVGGQNISLALDLSSRLPFIDADEFQLEQAVQNIARNALEAMAEGGVLRIRTAAADDNGSVDITMEDSGPGIPEKNREKVLQSFFTTKVKGTGLGLTIVQRVLRNHGGEILFEHPARGGTKVILRLPVRQTMEVNEQDGEGRALSAEGRGQRVWGRWQRT